MVYPSYSSLQPVRAKKWIMVKNIDIFFTIRWVDTEKNKYKPEFFSIEAGAEEIKMTNRTETGEGPTRKEIKPEDRLIALIVEYQEKGDEGIVAVLECVREKAKAVWCNYKFAAAGAGAIVTGASAGIAIIEKAEAIQRFAQEALDLPPFAAGLLLGGGGVAFAADCGAALGFTIGDMWGEKRAKKICQKVVSHFEPSEE